VRNVIYSSIALATMAAFIVATFYSFESKFIERGFIASADMGTLFLIAYIVLSIVLVSCVIMAFYRGSQMWRAESWKTGERTLSGVELKMEAAVIIGLGITLAFFLIRGLF
jgi:hypothetical protein